MYSRTMNKHEPPTNNWSKDLQRFNNNRAVSGRTTAEATGMGVREYRLRLVLLVRSLPYILFLSKHRSRDSAAVKTQKTCVYSGANCAPSEV